jgi:hypothetical protein
MVAAARLSALFGALLCLLCAHPAVAAESERFVAEHLAFEVAGVVAWRSAWADERNPGFQLAGGGPEVNIGLEFDNGLGVLLGGRALFSRHLGADPALEGTFAEAVGQLIGILRISDWVRLGLGGEAGRLWQCCGSDSPANAALLFGGFLRVGVDFLPRTTLPRALSLWLRLGIDGHRLADSQSQLPSASMNLAVGLGLRL